MIDKEPVIDKESDDRWFPSEQYVNKRNGFWVRQNLSVVGIDNGSGRCQPAWSLPVLVRVLY